MRKVTQAGVDRAYSKFQRALERDYNWRTGCPGSLEADKAAKALVKAEDEWRRLRNKLINQR